MQQILKQKTQMMQSGLIEAIIKANKNLTDSNSHNDWEMMGKDIKKLQELIDSLEITKKDEDKKKSELDKETNNTNENTTSSKENIDNTNKIE